MARGWPKPTAESDVARFWAKVDKSGPAPAGHPELGACWVWTGSIDKRWGYGYFHRLIDGHARNLKAHRFSWEIAFGLIPSDRSVLHHCDNPPCVRPEHLHLGDHTTNMAEMYERGRGRKVNGEAHPQAKLTEAKVIEIRRRYERGSRINGSVALGKEFGVDSYTIRSVVTGRRWKAIPR